jgi:hypothetical protein
MFGVTLYPDQPIDVLFGPWDLFDSFEAIGISDFILDRPADEDLGTFVAAARAVLPGRRPGA